MAKFTFEDNEISSQLQTMEQNWIQSRKPLRFQVQNLTHRWSTHIWVIQFKSKLYFEKGIYCISYWYDGFHIEQVMFKEYMFVQGSQLEKIQILIKLHSYFKIILVFFLKADWIFSLLLYRYFWYPETPLLSRAELWHPLCCAPVFLKSG